MSKTVVSIAMAAALAAMGWLNLYWVRTPLDLSPVGSEKATGQAEWNDAKPAAPPEPAQELSGQVSEALLRPLFHASRRPFEMAAPEPVNPEPVPEAIAMQPEPTAAAPPELRLAGVSLSGSRKQALIVAVQTSEARWYSAGETVEGWTIASVTSAEVTLANSGQSITVGLYPSSNQDGGQP